MTSSIDTPIEAAPRPPDRSFIGRSIYRLSTLIHRTGDRLSVRILASLFVIIFAILAAGTMVLTPPLQVPDAVTHFDRDVGISYGELIGSTSGKYAGGYLPEDVIRLDAQFAKLSFNGGTRASVRWYTQARSDSWGSPRVFTPFPSTTTRIPVLYLPGALAIVVTRIFSDKILVSYYAVECINLLLFLLMAWWSIRQFHLSLAVPMCILLLTPMIVSLAASPNPDGLVIGLSVVYGAAIYRLFQNRDSSERYYLSESSRVGFLRTLLPDGIGRNELIAWGSLALLSLDKPPYAVLGLLLGVTYLVRKKLGPYLVITALGIGSIGFLEFIWLAVGSRAGTDPTFPASANVSPARQSQYLLHHATGIPSFLVHTFHVQGSFYWHSAVGILGWLDTPLPAWAYYGAVVLFVVSVIGLIVTSRPVVLPLVVCGLAILIAMVLIVLTLYVDWTSVGAAVAQGVQGRYFLPLLPILIVCIGLSPRDPPRLQLPGVAGVVLMGLGCEVALTVALLTRYWATG